MNNNTQVVKEEKPFTLFTQGKVLYVRKGEVKISTKQFETIHTLFQVPQEYLSYSTLLDGKHSESNNAACSTAMQTQKREINREIKKTSQSQCFELIKNFSAFKNKAKWGYKIDEWFFVRIQPK